jgi:signal transduction histidine kinase
MSIASHELRGPLGTLGMGLEVVREAPTGDAIDSAQRQVRRLAALVQELLEVTRVGVPRLELRPRPTDLAELAAGVVARLESDLRAASCAITLQAQPCIGSWDPLRVDQLITNLVTNAARHAPGSPITITIEALGDRVRLRVADHGPGIALRDQARIFDAYRSLQRKGPGLGLGLHIAREIVLAHGGTLTVESELGRGAAFVAELPCHPMNGRRVWMRWPLRPTGEPASRTPAHT